MDITDQAVSAYRLGAGAALSTGETSADDLIRAGLAEVAPLIAAQALRDDAAKIERWSSGTEDAVDRLLAAVRGAVPGPLRDDWRTDAADLVAEIEVAWARAQHPDDRARLSFILASLAGFWLSDDERDAAWLGETS